MSAGQADGYGRALEGAGNLLDIPAGYTRTAVGVTPEDWRVSTVGAEFSVQLGKMLDAAKNTGVPKPYIGNRAVQWGRIDLADVDTVPMTSADLRRFRLRSGDLLVCEGGEIGRAAIWEEPIQECYFQKALHRLRPIRGYDSYLMMSLLQLWASTGYLTNYVTQTSIAHLPKDKLETVPLPVPRAAEQRAIAAVLSDVDELIGSLEALIAKKLAIKQAAMQELLTGRTRLPGFGGEWDEGRLGLIAQLHREHVMPDPANETPYMHFSLPAYDAGRRPVMEPGEAIRSGKFRIPNDAILLSRLNPRIPRVWAPTRIGLNAVASTEFLVMTPKASTVRAFLYYLCSSREFSERMVLAVTGTTGSHQRVNRSDAMQLVVRFPKDLPEQRAIATILSDMDAEIAALERRLDKTRAIKQGMMQQLLTGFIRLPIPDDDTEDDDAHDA